MHTKYRLPYIQFFEGEFMKANRRPLKQKIPAEFTRYLLEGIRKVREAATVHQTAQDGQQTTNEVQGIQTLAP